MIRTLLTLIACLLLVGLLGELCPSTGLYLVVAALAVLWALRAIWKELKG